MTGPRHHTSFEEFLSQCDRSIEQIRTNIILDTALTEAVKRGSTFPRRISIDFEKLFADVEADELRRKEDEIRQIEGIDLPRGPGRKYISKTDLEKLRAEIAKVGDEYYNLTKSARQEHYIYYGPKWGQVRRLARLRSQGICERCRKRKATATHHRIPVRFFENYDDAHYLENLIDACRLCHKILDREAREAMPIFARIPLKKTAKKLWKLRHTQVC